MTTKSYNPKAYVKLTVPPKVGVMKDGRDYRESAKFLANLNGLVVEIGDNDCVGRVVYGNGKWSAVPLEWCKEVPE